MPESPPNFVRQARWLSTMTAPVPGATASFGPSTRPNAGATLSMGKKFPVTAWSMSGSRSRCVTAHFEATLSVNAGFERVSA